MAPPGSKLALKKSRTDVHAIDKAEGGGLHTAGGQSLADLAPEDGAEAIADETIKDTSGLIGVDEIDIDAARLVKGAADGVLGDLMKDDAPHPILRNAGGLHQVP